MVKPQYLFLTLFAAIAQPSPTRRYSRGASPLRQSYNASALLDSVIGAVGGIDTLRNLTGFIFQSSSIYRSQTLTQNYNLAHSDQSVADAGSQNLSFSISSGSLQERIDRRYQYNDYWIWARADLEPSIDYTLVLQDGNDGYACVTRGTNVFFADDLTQAAGYADPYLTDYLIHQAQQYALPWLLNQFLADAGRLTLSEIIDPITGISLQVIEHPDIDLALIVDSITDLPYMVRSWEEHVIFGSSTSDLLFSNFSNVALNDDSNASLLLPHRMLTIYNSINVIEDFVIEEIVLNPTFPDDFFEALPQNETHSEPSAPAQSSEYPRSEVHEFFETGLWQGPYDPNVFNISSVVVKYPLPGLGQVSSIYVAYADYVQLLVEFEDGILITDAPAHRSQIIIEWVQQTMGKNITYVVPSHHHHDHASGVADYVAQGATLVVPEIAKPFYANVNNGSVSFETYTQDHPFVLTDGNVQFTSLWRDENPHAKDWSYGVATKACPTANDTAVAFIADVVDPGSQSIAGDGLKWDFGYARQWLNAAVQDGLPKSSIVVCAHGGEGTTTNLSHILELTGFAYPDLTGENWKATGNSC